MDYVLEALNHQLHGAMSHNSFTYDEILTESAFLIASIEHMIVVSEAEQAAGTEGKVVAKTGGVASAVGGAVKKGGDIFRRIKEFLTKIIGIFTDKVRVMTQGNKAWLDQNKSALSELSYNGLQVEMTPFWNIDMKNAIGTVESQINRLLILSAVNNKPTTGIDAVKKAYFAQFLDEDGELTNGAKNYFRTGKSTNAGARQVSISADQLKEKVVSEFLPYCETYGTAVQPQLTKLINSANNKLEILAKSLGEARAATKESFLLEDFGQAVALMEAEGDAKSPTHTTVKVNDTTDNGSVSVGNNTKSMNADSIETLKHIAQCVQIISAAALTAAEERYNAYMNAMKQIAKTRKGTSEEKKPDDTKDTKAKKI